MKTILIKSALGVLLVESAAFLVIGFYIELARDRAVPLATSEYVSCGCVAAGVTMLLAWFCAVKLIRSKDQIRKHVNSSEKMLDSLQKENKTVLQNYERISVSKNILTLNSSDFTSMIKGVSLELLHAIEAREVGFFLFDRGSGSSGSEGLELYSHMYYDGRLLVYIHFTASQVQHLDAFLLKPMTARSDGSDKRDLSSNIRYGTLINRDTNEEMGDFSIEYSAVGRDSVSPEDIFCSLRLDGRNIETAFSQNRPKVMQDFIMTSQGENGENRKNTHILTVPLIAEEEPIGVCRIFKDDVVTQADSSTRIRELDDSRMEWAINLLEESKTDIAVALHKGLLYKRATTDPLTGLYNRMHFNNILKKTVTDSVKKREPFSMILIDIDHFKNVNDTYGHLSGDIILRDVARILSRTVRIQDSVYRYGGEEMAVILPGSGLNDAAAVAERLRVAIENHGFRTDKGKKIKITVSLGVSEYVSNRGKGINSLIDAADKALYIAKENGRNQVVKEN